MKKYVLLFSLIILISTIVVLAFVIVKKTYTPEQQAYIREVEEFRTVKDQEMKNSPDSPFNAKGKVHFENLKYFEPDPSFVFYSKLTEYEKKDTVIIYGTKGEPRKSVKFGYLIIKYNDRFYNINVYKGFTRTGQEYYAIWFTDRTTNNETYGVGRYLDFELNNNKDYLYKIDFNMAYNPYCAYSANYSCAIPTKDDYLDMEINAGEKKFHN